MNFHIQIQLDSNFQGRTFFVFFLSLSVDGLFLPKKEKEKKNEVSIPCFLLTGLLAAAAFRVGRKKRRRGRILTLFSSSSLRLLLLAGPGFLPPVKPPTAESLPVRAPVAPVGFLLFLFCVNMYSFWGISREEEFQKSMRKKRYLRCVFCGLCWVCHFVGWV